MNNHTEFRIDVNYVLKYGDPRLQSLPLMQSPSQSIILCLCYFSFTKVIGPTWMRNRKPFDLRRWMILYNISMVILSGWMFLRFSKLWFLKYNWRCESIDFSSNEDGVTAVMTCYVYFLSKFVEFLDTIFFVLRKKFSQITFLHSVHHGFVPLTCYYGVKYGGGGYAIILPLMNVFVHVWMYSYYALSAMGPSVQKYLWWKKYLTTLQLIQFVTVMVSVGQLVVFPAENCNASNFTIWLILGQAIGFFVLFVHFYSVTYNNKTSKSNGDHRNGTTHKNHTITNKAE